MPTGTFGDVTADANRAIFLKRKATALFNRVERGVVEAASRSSNRWPGAYQIRGEFA